MVSLAQSLTTRSRLAQALTLLVASLLLLVAFVRNDAGAVAPADGPFERTWARTDKPVADGEVSRTWIWGPEAFTEVIGERYDDSPGDVREVQYFDKSRMEINCPAGACVDSDPDAPWYVTNGLLVVEMVDGKVQVGDTTFDESPDPADIPIAGDPDSGAPTYAQINQFGLRSVEPAPTDLDMVTERLANDGSIVNDKSLEAYGVVSGPLAPETSHRVASIFWDFMTSESLIYDVDSNQYVVGALFESPYYATGLPITEPYWTTATVEGRATDILWQCFERRCLTYTPGNDPGWQVEAGNVGRHYFTWRYGQNPSEPTPTATSTSTATPTPTSTPTVEPTATLPDGVTTTGDMEIESITDAGVIIRNMQVAGDIQMAGWQLRDDGGHVYTFPALVVREGFYVTVANCAGQDIIENKYAILHWGECVSPFPQGQFHLYDSTGTLVDSYPG